MHTIKAKDLADHVDKSLRGWHKKALETLQTTAELRAPLHFQTEIVRAQPQQPVDRERYKGAFHVRRIKNGALLYNTAPYSGVLEYGRRRGAKMPPIDIIMKWAKRKGIAKPSQKQMSAYAKRKEKNPNARPPKANLTPSQWRSLAFMIARKIASRGLPRNGKPMMILHKTRDRTLKDVKSAILKVAVFGGP